MTFNNGVILLAKITDGQTLCELDLPLAYKPLPIWDPIVASVQTKPDPSQEDAELFEATYVYINGMHVMLFSTIFYNIRMSVYA